MFNLLELIGALSVMVRITDSDYYCFVGVLPKLVRLRFYVDL